MTCKRETPIVLKIIRVLEADRVWCWRQNSGVLVIGKGKTKRVVRMAPPGTPDVLGFLSSGRGFGLEVKTRTGKQSVSQKVWQKKAESNGVRYAVVRSANEAFMRVREWELE